MGRFNPEDIDPTLCTHVVYAFGTLKDHLLTEGSDKDAELYNRLIAIRDKNPDIKVFIKQYFTNYYICVSPIYIFFNIPLIILSSLSTQMRMENYILVKCA